MVMPMNPIPNENRRSHEREILTPNQLSESLACRKLADYRFKQRLIPVDENENQTLRQAVHRGLSAWYESFDKPHALSAVEQSLCESTFRTSLLPLASGMLEGYIEHWKRRDAFTVLHVDLPYLTPIVTPSGRASRIQDLAGVAPLVIEKPDGSTWLMISRVISRKDPNLDQRLDTDLRIRAACWAVNRYLPGGVSGVIVDVLRAKLPVEPEILKNGTVSRRANIDTTLEVFTQALNCSGSDPADYAEILERLAGEDDGFFRRWEREYTSEETAASGYELYLVARDLRRSGREPVFGNPAACTTYGLCPYLDLCKGGSDASGSSAAYRRLERSHPEFAGVDVEAVRRFAGRKRRSEENKRMPLVAETACMP
jgi:hypothetical protein